MSALKALEEAEADGTNLDTHQRKGYDGDEGHHLPF